MTDANNKSAGTTAYFGDEEIPSAEKSARVAEVFRSVAGRYDVMNDIMSLGSHRLIKRFALQLCALRPGQTVLDLAGGTGDLSRLMARLVGGDGRVVLADINGEMLRQGRDRLIDKGMWRQSDPPPVREAHRPPLKGGVIDSTVTEGGKYPREGTNNHSPPEGESVKQGRSPQLSRWGVINVVQCDAELMPFAEGSFDRICIAYGLRNVTRKEAALRAMLAALKPGGRAVILEFSKAESPLLEKAFNAWSSLWPAAGKLVAGDAASYRYLVESIRHHPDQQTLLAMMTEAGFKDCRCHNVLGGLCAIHIGFKP